jgi:hypothetical protein
MGASKGSHQQQHQHLEGVVVEGPQKLGRGQGPKRPMLQKPQHGWGLSTHQRPDTSQGSRLAANREPQLQDQAQRMNPIP